MALLLVLLLIVVPIAELWVIIEVGREIGAGPTILILLLDSLLGAYLLRRQGRRAWQRFNGALAEGRLPHREAIDGVLVIFGGALLLTPGFITDAVGFLLLIPPTHLLVRSLLIKHLKDRVARGGSAFYMRWPQRGPQPKSPTTYDVDGTAEEVPDELPSRPRLEPTEHSD